MAAKIFYAKDASLEPLQGKTIVFLGYGNQGHAQALNLRDTVNRASLSKPPQILIANREDSYLEAAKKASFAHTTDFAHAASIADVLFLLIPDQVQPQIFNTQIAPNLKKGCAIVVASGYNLFYKKLEVPTHSDAVMVAPRMVGESVRSRFLSGEGFPCFLSVEQDGTGQAWPVTLALSLAIGALTYGSIASSAREETLTDLFAEQALWPQIIATFRESYSLLKSLGCSDEALVHELWLSREPAEIFEKCATDGFLQQLKCHSHVSQYGQLKGSGEVKVEEMQRMMREVAEKRILGGDFEKEFSALEEESKDRVDERIEELFREAQKSELCQGEMRVRERLGLPSKKQ